MSLICSSIQAQTGIDRAKSLDMRLNKIQYYHVGVGMDIAGNQNYMIVPKVFVGIGSNRTLYNFDFGLKLKCSNIIRFTDSEYISNYNMPFFLAGSLNVIRWKKNCLYVGAEGAYNIALSSSHSINNKRIDTETHNISRSYFSLQGRIGFRYRNIDFSVYYENDLSPSLEQKYVYESTEYDYFKLHDSIFERCRIGLSVTYNFRF